MAETTAQQDLTHKMRTDPQPGDRLRAKGRTRRVVRREGGDIYYLVEEAKTPKEKNCWISTWMEWACGNRAEVVTS